MKKALEWARLIALVLCLAAIAVATWAALFMSLASALPPVEALQYLINQFIQKGEL